MSLGGLNLTLRVKLSQDEIDSIFSDTFDLEYGVPQGSVSGPLGYILYTSPVGNIIRKHGLKFHVYPDDTQIYVAFNPRSPWACRAALPQLEHCITDLSDWMSTNMLKLNPNFSLLELLKDFKNVHHLLFLRLVIA